MSRKSTYAADRLRSTPVIFFFLLCSILSARSQGTYTIDYTWLAKRGCNVFATATSFYNITHLTSLGYPAYSTTSQSVALACSYKSDVIYSTTRFSLAFNFKQDYKYYISVYGKGKAPSTSLPPWLGVKISDNTEGTNPSTSCSSPADVEVADVQTYVQALLGTSNAWNSNVIHDAVMDKNYGYLLLSAYPSSHDTNDTAFVNQVIIQEVAPFSLSPANLTLHCGEQLTQTFTVANNSSLPNITAYTWNLGSPNVWLYNGSPAPATITTTTNTLTLTSSGSGGSPGNISATVTYSGRSFTTNASSLTFDPSLPAMHIVGNDIVCTSDNFSVYPLPLNATVAWSLTPVNYATLTTLSNGVVKVTRNGTSVGEATLTATVTSTCGGNPVTINKMVVIGTVKSLILGPYDPSTNFIVNVINTGKQYYFMSNDPVLYNFNTYTWTFTPPGVYTYLYAGNKVTLSFPDEGNYNLQLQKTNSCGTTFASRTLTAVQGFRMAINTTPNSVTVSAHNTGAGATSGQKSIDQINVYNMNGALVKSVKGNAAFSVTMDTHSFASGMYILEVRSGKTINREKFIVQH